MIQQAKFATETVMVKGRCLSVRRGDLVASVRYLAQRWNWSKGRVERFMDLLRQQNMIGTRTETGISVISLCNYDAYNPSRDKNGTQTGTVAGQSRDSRGTNKKKERKEEGEEVSPNGDKADRPPAPLDCEEFESKWEEYERYRRQSKMKKLKPVSIRKQWAEMAEWGVMAAIESIDQTIKHGWQGLFAPKHEKQNGKDNRSSPRAFEQRNDYSQYRS